MIAKVEEIFSDTYVKLSIRYFYKYLCYVYYEIKYRLS